QGVLGGVLADPVLASVHHRGDLGYVSLTFGIGDLRDLGRPPAGRERDQGAEAVAEAGVEDGGGGPGRRAPGGASVSRQGAGRRGPARRTGRRALCPPGLAGWRGREGRVVRNESGHSGSAREPGGGRAPGRRGWGGRWG